MKRSEFLKRLGIGIVAVPLAPQIIPMLREDPRLDDEVADDEAAIIRKTHQTLPAEVYGHYEEQFTHGKWPLRVWDCICIGSSDNMYVVTSIMGGVATCVPTEDGETVYATADDDIIRFSNLKANL